MKPDSQATPTGIAGAADHGPRHGMTCYVCHAAIEMPYTIRGMRGVGAVAACSKACAGSNAFRSESERLADEIAMIRELPIG